MVLLMVSVNVVNIIRIIMNTQVNGENHKEHTMQFLFLCIYARGWGDHNELNRVFSHGWCCVFNGWGFFIWFGFRHKICNKIIFQHPFGPTVLITTTVLRANDKNVPTKKQLTWIWIGTLVHRTTCTLSNQAKLHQRALFQHTW